MLDSEEVDGAMLRMVEGSKSKVPHNPLADAGQALPVNYKTTVSSHL